MSWRMQRFYALTLVYFSDFHYFGIIYTANKLLKVRKVGQMQISI